MLIKKQNRNLKKILLLKLNFWVKAFFLLDFKFICYSDSSVSYLTLLPNKKYSSSLF